MSELTVAAQRLPGIGWRYTVPAAQDRLLVIVVEDRGPRHLVIVDPAQDQPLTAVRLSGADATAVAALLTGARFRFAPTADLPEPAPGGDGEVVVETVSVGSDSPLVGVPQADAAARIGARASLLAVIDDGTSQLVELDPGRGIQPGDRLVVAVRRARLPELRAAL